MSNSSNKKALAMLFERPLEPVFTKRDNGNAVFELPENFYQEQYKEVKEDIQTRFGEDVNQKIPLKQLSKMPDLSFCKPIGRRRQLSLFNPAHQHIAGRLVGLLMDAPDEDDFISLCAYCKDRVNAFLFQYCYSVAVQHRKDTENFPVKPIAEEFPHNFVEPTVFQDARAEAEIVKDPGSRRHIEIEQNYTASDREDEQRLAYFREDIGVNSHHWHWHLVYPGSGPENVVRKDRRGELFYYMHHQIVARYNVERFCNNLKRLKPLNNVREPIPEGYFPKILSGLTNRTYPGRLMNTVLKDIERDGNSMELADLERWIDRVVQAIDQGYVTTAQGNNIPLDPVKGIDILGDIIESTDLSVNRGFYGNIHNMGHNAISYAHDPDFRFLEEFGVMGDVTTAMRDPVFYRWHGFVDTIFNRFKTRLEPYTDQELGFNGIQVQGFEVRITAGQGGKPNTLLTYWERSDVDLHAGLDFAPDGNIYATFTHLQHAPFNYQVNINNSSGSPMKGTCRIFICPRADDRGTPLRLEEQRLLAIELDKFTVNLTPGLNTMNRSSSSSSVTIPYERSFRRLGKSDMPQDENALAEFRFCGCGWPEHMLLPKGKPEGMPFDMFVMISDFKDDAVQQSNNGSPSLCDDSASFCGLKDKLYPDKRSMGFPFDRRLPGDTLNDLTGRYTNMKAVEVKVIFNNLVVNRQQDKKVIKSY